LIQQGAITVRWIAANAATSITSNNLAHGVVNMARVSAVNVKFLFVMKYLGSRPLKMLKTSELVIKSLLLVAKLLLSDASHAPSGQLASDLFLEAYSSPTSIR
jgi:hypothetical protein